MSAAVRVAVVHNLPRGGAHRRLSSQLPHLDADVVEICLSTASPITPDAVVVPVRRYAEHRARWWRPPLRYVDLELLVAAWRRAARRVAQSGADALYLNPCAFLQAPPVLGPEVVPPALYFCDEPRRVDYEPAAEAMRNPLTRGLYGPAYARERRLDRGTVARSAALATNSRYTAAQIERAYGRTATVVALGVPESLLDQPPAGGERYVLSVGTLIAGKGHELVIGAAAAAAARPGVVIVAPRPDPEVESRLRAMAAGAGVSLTVQTAISDASLGSLMAGALATLYLARQEPLGLVSLEAQACGCPVVVSAEGGLPETIEEGVSGWAVPREAAAAARALDHLAEPGMRDAAGLAARRRGRRHTWSVSAAEITRLLRDLPGVAA